MLLDYGRNIRRHGPLEDITVSSATSRTVSEKINRSKTCPGCQNEIAIATKVCKICGYQYTKEEMKLSHELTADDIDPLKPIAERYEINKILYSKHNKAGRPPSLRVIYFCGTLFNGQQFSKYVCFEHGGYAAELARLWSCRMGVFPAPKTVDEALERQNEFIKPKGILVNISKKYPEIIDYEF